MGESPRGAGVGRAGRGGLFVLAEAYRAFVKQRPGLYAATVRSYRLSDPDDPEFGAAEGEALEPVLAVLASCGIRDGEEGIHAARGLRRVAHGFAPLEEAGGFGMAVDHDESFRKLVHAYTTGLLSV